MWTDRARTGQRGSALLMVLWVSAALAAIAFSLSTTVLGETQRTSTSVDGLRAYYLAEGGFQRAAYELAWAAEAPEKFRVSRNSPIDYTFPSGLVHVEVVPETSKLNVNLADAQELYRMVEALGVDSNRAGEIAAAIEDWRAGGPGSRFDQYYLSFTPSFRGRHTSFEEIEELLSVKGITPELYYGTYLPAEGGAAADAARLMKRPGLADCLSVFGSPDFIDANTAPTPVLAAVGMSPDAIANLLRSRPLNDSTMNAVRQAGVTGTDRLKLGGNYMYTLRATARLRLPDGQLSDLRRTVAALVSYKVRANEGLFYVLRWYDTTWNN
jgi:general secretion pathway protein K